MAKNSKPRAHDWRWYMSLIKATPAKYLRQIFATTEAEAIKGAGEMRSSISAVLS